MLQIAIVDYYMDEYVHSDLDMIPVSKCSNIHTDILETSEIKLLSQPFSLSLTLVLPLGINLLAIFYCILIIFGT